jgi:DNA-binding transcriptional LysR family regulator
MLDWDDLRFFVALARRGSLSETARHLKTDHTTVARRVAALERSFGVKLFDRMPRGYVLTEQGARLAARASGVEEAVFSVARLAAGAGETLGGRVCISAPPALASHWLVPRLAPLRASHPAMLLEVVGETGAANLARREADIALRLSRPTGEALVAKKLGALRYGLYGSRAYIDATPKKAWQFLGYNDELAEVPQQRWLADYAGDRAFALLTNDLVSLISGVRSGMGLAALPHVLAASEGDLVRVCEARSATRDLWLVVHPDLRRAARVRVVMDHLATIAEDLRR